jgi:membrane peptidoglycan carboxypeptidase
VLLIACGVGALATIIMVGVAYAMTPVPQDPNKDSTFQGTTVLWRDGSQLAKIGNSRTIVPLSAVSPNMQAAVLAAEDRKFYHESAISPTGIARAVVNDLSGGDTQGGSTITQQYVKNAYLNQERTVTRKFKELFIAIKVNKQLDKSTILERYLNTIYFGRDANGVEAAAQAYYRKSAKDLTVPEAAVLASNIKQPGYYDPRLKAHLNDTIARYNFVLDGMVKTGKLSAADYAKYKDHPPMTKKPRGDLLAGQTGFLVTRVRNALHNMGYTADKISTGGLRVYTTWDKNLQRKAEQAVLAQLRTRQMPRDTRVGLVTIDPTKGDVLAAYGGKDFLKRQLDDAFYDTAQVGSSFKPYVLATALEQNIGLKSKFDARSPQWINTDGKSVSPHAPNSFRYFNDEGNTNEIVDLVQATAESYNTVYVPLGFKAGSQNVYDLADKAGLPADAMKQQVGQGGFFLGQAQMSPLQLATGYATIANDGQYVTPHTITKVIEPGGQVKKTKVERHTAFNADIAHDVQYAMQAVVKNGTGVRAQIPGREIAGKTGTTNQNNAAWFSGFTPKQLVTTVGMWRFDDAITKGKHKHRARYVPLQNVGGLARINGGDLPAQIWHDYMTQALQGKPFERFDPPAYVGETKLYATPKPTPTPSPSVPVCMPGQDPLLDQCQPGNPNSTSKMCQRNPELPQCQQQQPSPSPTCQSLIGCPDSTPPNRKHSTTSTQQRSARPLTE